MYLRCPNCRARYAVDGRNWRTEADAPPKRRVRCSSCGEVWWATASDLEADARPDTGISTTDIPDTDIPGDAPPPGRAVRRLVGCGALLLLVMAGVALGIVLHGNFPSALSSRLAAVRVMRLPDMRLPDVRLPDVRVPPLDLSWARLPGRAASPFEVAVESTKVMTLPDGQAAWHISGIIRNPTDQTPALPPIEVSIRDRDGRTLDRWTIHAAQPALAPGETLTFDTTRIAPPSDGHSAHAEARPASLARP